MQHSLRPKQLGKEMICGINSLRPQLLSKTSDTTHSLRPIQISKDNDINVSYPLRPQLLSKTSDTTHSLRPIQISKDNDINVSYPPGSRRAQQSF